MGKKLSQFEIATRDILRKGVTEFAADQVRKGVGYLEIEKLLKQEGIVDHNGRAFHNAIISKMVVDAYPELRKRKPNKKKTEPNLTKEEIVAKSMNNLAEALRSIK